MRITKYFKGVAEEARRVRWPNKTVLWSAVGIVCSITIVAALGLMLCDFLTAQILKSFENAFPADSASSSAVAIMLNVIGGIL